MATHTQHVPVASDFDLGDPTPNAVGRKARVSHEGCVVHLEPNSANRLMWSGEDLLDVKLPAGTRVVYPKPTIPGIPDREAGIRYALAHPEEMDPLEALLRPGMKVTIAIDDISKPLPKMFKPDVRQSILEIVLELLTAKGVTDVHLIIATAFHRRMEPFEIRHAVGNRIFDAYHPDRLYNHDGEAPDGMVELGVTDHGEHARINRRAAESDLLIYVNVSLVPMGGGNQSVSVGLSDYAVLQAHHNPQTIAACDSYFDYNGSALARSTDRLSRVIEKHLKVFHIDTVTNNAMFDPKLAFFMKNEDRWSALDRASFKTAQWALKKMPRATKRKLLFAFPAPYGLTAIHAGATEACYRKNLAYSYSQYCVPVEGQSDVVVFGVPFISPYNVNSILNPLLVRVLALGYFFNMYRGMPVVKKNGVLILTHPLYDEFDPRHHAAYNEFFHRVLPESTDSSVLQKYEAEFAHNPEYIEMYRHGYGYHGVHPFYMWYWGENGHRHCGKVIVVGAEDKMAAKVMGWDCAATMDEAIEMAQSHVGRKPSITHVHIPPINMVDVAGTRETI
ncbi:MAG: lactate racemase domain-containing protein [Bryobacterales bacterium]